MKTREFFDWFLERVNDYDLLHTIVVPDEPEQTENWWWDNVGSLPPSPIPAGEYLMAVPNEGYNALISDLCSHFNADVEIESGDGYVYLYKIES
jgi:hypothetical protein